MKARQGDDGRIPALDLLRVIAALSVVAFHYLYLYEAVHGHPGDAFAPVIAGYLGVNLFFLISGFVIAQSAEGRSAAEFAVARFARIYPGFVACMALTSVVLLLAGDPRFPASVPQFLANLAILSPALGQPFLDGVYWSIVIEIVFYGWVALAVGLRIFDRFRLELVAAWLVLAMLNEFGLRNEALRLVLATEYASLFAAGILLHHIKMNGARRETLLLLLAAFLISTHAMQATRDWMLGHYGEALSLTQLAVANIAIHVLMIAAVRLPWRPRNGAAVVMFGALTYPLYLLHQNIGYVLIERLQPLAGRAGALALTMALVLLLCWAVWRCVERPSGWRIKSAADAILRKYAPLASAPNPARHP